MVVWMRMVFTRCACSSELQFGALREVVSRERQWALSRKAPGKSAEARASVFLHDVLLSE